MKYIYTQDFHLKGKNPSSRTDNYYDSWMKKFKELLKLAKKYKVDKIISGGDFFDIPNVADSIVDEVLDLIEETNIPVHMMWGNHDEVGHNRLTSNGSSMAHMLRRCKLLSEGDLIQGPDHTIILREYEHNIEQKLKDEPITIVPLDAWKILILHAFVLPKPFMKEVLHVVADDIKTNADLCLVAHYHQPWEKQVGTTRFLDIGCFGRCKIDEADIEPSVLLLDTKKRTTEIIKLKSAQPGSEVFDLTKREHKDEMNADLDSFINSLRDFKSQTSDLYSVIEMIGKEQNIDREILDLIIKRIGELNASSKS